MKPSEIVDKMDTKTNCVPSYLENKLNEIIR